MKRTEQPIRAPESMENPSFGEQRPCHSPNHGEKAGSLPPPALSSLDRTPYAGSRHVNLLGQWHLPSFLPPQSPDRRNCKIAQTKGILKVLPVRHIRAFTYITSSETGIQASMIGSTCMWFALCNSSSS
jgi:hypothetical protein